MKANLLVGFFFCLFGVVYSQDEISVHSLLNEIRTYQEDENWESYLLSIQSLSEQYLDNEQIDSSILYLEKALDISYHSFGVDSIWAKCYHQLGISYYTKTNDKEAIKNWSKAINIRKNIFPENHLDIIKGYRNIGTAYIQYEELDLGIQNLNKAYDLNISRKNPDEIRIAQLSGELGSAYTLSEDLDRAIRYLTIAEEQAKLVFQEEYWEINYIYNRWWHFYNLKGDTEKMKSYSNKSIDLLESVDDKYDEDYMDMASAYNNLGIAFEIEKKYDKSKSAYLKSIQLYKNLIHIDYVEQYLASCYSNVSLVFKYLNDYESALQYINKALSLDTKNNKIISEVIDLDNKAEILLKKGDTKNALLTINEAIAKSKKEKGDNLYTVNKQLRILLNRTKGKVLNEIFDHDKDIQHLKDAAASIPENVKLLDEIRNGFQSEESKAFLAVEAKSIMEEAIRVYLKIHQIKGDDSFILKAWELSAKAKSIILLESLRTSQAKKSTGVKSLILQKEDSLKKQLAFLENEIYNQPDEAVRYNQQFLDTTSELEKLQAKIMEENPKYSQATMDIADFSIEQSLYGIQEDVIEYFLGEKNNYVFSKTESGISCHEISADYDISKLMNQIRKSTVDIFKNSLVKDEKYKAAVSLYNASASNLYTALISSVNDKAKLGHDLLVIPDGILGYLPFDLLLTESSEGNEFNTKPYLINDHNISYTYSLALLDEMKNAKHTKTTSQLLAMAPLFENNDEVYKYGDRIVKKEKQPSLYFNVSEGEAVQAIMGGDMISGTQATEAYFMDHAADYKIIHLSTHGKANDDKGSFSYLAFTEIVDSTENEFVYNYDLYNLDLNAEMVVLSACETGLGELKAGEGIISLSRGFSYAGAKSIINTLWTINDYRTKEIMESFYTGIAAGQEKNIALRTAKLKFIEDNPNEALPFYWAAFIPVGDMSAIQNSSSFNPKILILFITLVSFMIAYFMYRKKNKHNA